MNQPVTVQQDGLTITTNTVSEADLRAELGMPAPAAAPPGAPPNGHAAADPPPPDDKPREMPARDDKGRFLARAEATTPPGELPEGEPAPPEPESPGVEDARRPSPKHLASRTRAIIRSRA